MRNFHGLATIGFYAATLTACASDAKTDDAQAPADAAASDAAFLDVHVVVDTAVPDVSVSAPDAVVPDTNTAPVDAAADAATPPDVVTVDARADASPDVLGDAGPDAPPDVLRDAPATDAGLDAALTDAVVIDVHDAAVDAHASCAVNRGADAGDATALCPGGEWRDRSTSSCVACPTNNVTCADVASAHVDTAARTLTVTLAAGHTEVASGTMLLSYSRLYCNGQYGPGNTDPNSEITLPFVVSGDTLVVDTSAITADAGTARPCGTHTLTFTDTCCDTHAFRVTVAINDEGGDTYLACPPASDAGGGDGG